VPDLSEKTWLRFKLGAVVAGLAVVGTAAVNIGIYYAGINAMKTDLDAVKKSVGSIAADLKDHMLTKEEAELYLHTAEAMNPGWKAPPVR
jgi:hypothetical protein